MSGHLTVFGRAIGPQPPEREPLLRRPRFIGGRPIAPRHHSFQSFFERPAPPERSASEVAAAEFDRLRQQVHEAEERAEAGILRLVLRAAWAKVRHRWFCC